MQNTKTISAIVALFFIMSSNNLTASGKLPHTPAPYASNASTPNGRTHVDNSAREESEHTGGLLGYIKQGANSLSSLLPSFNVAFGQRNNEVEQSGDTYSGDTNSNNTNNGIVNSGPVSNSTYGGTVNSGTYNDDTNSNNTNNGTVNSGAISGNTGNVVNNHGGDTYYNNNNYYIYCDSAVAADVMAAMRTAETERDYKKQDVSGDDSCHDGYETEEMESSTPDTPTLEVESDDKKDDLFYEEYFSKPSFF